MNWLGRYASSSIGKKQIVAVTGLLLTGFLIAHLAGNFLIFDALGGKKAFNEYSHKLISNPLIYLAEGGLLAIFLVHVGFTLKLTAENRAARGPEPYAVVRSRGAPSRRSFASQWMVASGMLVLVFTALHLKTFKFGPWYDVKGHGMRDLHRLVVEVFTSPGYVGWYVVAMVVIGLHLHHALASTFETFGLDHPRWTPAIGLASKGLAWAIAGGFLTIPVLVKMNIGVHP